MFYRKPVVWNVMRVWESAHRVASLLESTKGKNGDNALTANAAWTFASSAIATFTAHGTAALFAKRAEWTALLERRKARRIWGDCSTRNTSINMPWEFIPRHTLDVFRNKFDGIFPFSQWKFRWLSFVHSSQCSRDLMEEERDNQEFNKS